MRTLKSCTVALAAGLAVIGCQDSWDRIEPPTEPSQAREVSVHGREVSGRRPLGGPAIGLQLIAEGLTSPVVLTEVPDGSGRLFVADQLGLIRIIMPDGTLLDEPFLDLRARMVTLWHMQELQFPHRPNRRSATSCSPSGRIARVRSMS